MTTGYPFLDQLHQFQQDTMAVSAMLQLQRVRRLAERLDLLTTLPPVIHIAGTNGKGSVAAMLSTLLNVDTHPVGLFTSPHLVDVTERIRLGDKTVSPQRFTQAVHGLQEKLNVFEVPRESYPTFFEAIVLLAFYLFAEEKMALAILETGLGGRLDATNIVETPLITVITAIGLDHTQHLGDTLAKIASEKAGIIKPGVPVVVGPNLPGEALTVICDIAQDKNAPLVVAEATRLVVDEVTLSGGQVLTDTTTGHSVQLPLLGVHQVDNLATVLSVIGTLSQHVPSVVAHLEGAQAMNQHLAKTHWPGRLQVLRERRVLLDGAHNAAGFEALCQSIQALLPKTPLVFLLTLRQNRDAQMLLAILHRYQSQTHHRIQLILSPGPSQSLYHHAADLHAAALSCGFTEDQLICAESLQAAQSALRQHLGASAAAWGVVAGSLYTVGTYLATLK